MGAWRIKAHTRSDQKRKSVEMLHRAFEQARDASWPSASPKTVYHFTTRDSGSSILASHVLWATDLRHSRNDPNELECGFELLRRAIQDSTVFKEIREGAAGELRELCFHASCLSAQLNVASQWK